MFNAESIIELEKKWLKYKIKQISIFYILILSIIIVVSIVVYYFLFQEKVLKSNVKIKTLIEKTDEAIKEPKKTIILKKEKKKVLIQAKKNETNLENNISKINIKNKEIKPYFFKLKPREQGSELFSSNGFLIFNSPIKIQKKLEDIEPIRVLEKIMKPLPEKKKKLSISIDMQEMDTIKYLKEKYYATSSIVFALMLSEEFYNKSQYKESLKWALTANDTDAQDTKSWYWFAKSKVKLNQKDDAIRALKAYLSHNKSKTLNTLLNKIQHGDTDD